MATGIADGDPISVGHDIFSGVNSVRGSEFADTLTGSNNPTGVEVFEGRGGDDTINGGGGFDRASYFNEDHFITVSLAAGDVVGGANTGHDTLQSIELIVGTNSGDTYDATGFSTSSTNAGDAGVNGAGVAFNEFEGAGGNDTITGNGNTRIAYYDATDGVAVTLGAGGSGTSQARAVVNLQPYLLANDVTADPANVGSDNIVSGVTQVRGSPFADNITGNGGSNVLEGQAGDDTLSGNGSGTGGTDTLTGGSGADRFVFTSGSTIITDFDQGEGAFNQNEADRIDLRSAAGVTNFAALGLSQDLNGNAIITTSGTNTIKVMGVPMAQLHDYDFIFPGQVSLNIYSPNGFDFSNIYNDFANIDVTKTAHDTTHYIVSDPTDGFLFTLVTTNGTTFTYDASGNPTGGTVNNIGIYDSSYNLISTLNGTNISLVNFVNAVATHNTSALDGILFNNANIHYTAVGSEAPDNNANAGGDTFVASVNSDIFDGRTNANGDIFGGDTVDYSHAAAGVTVNLGLSGAQNTGGSGLDQLFNIENLRGSGFADTLVGDANSNILEGGPGDDTLNGGGGGNDTASYEHALSGVTVNLGVFTQQDTIGAGKDTLIGIGNVRGSASADTLTGNGNSMLEGGSGGDHLIGQSGGQDTASYQHASAGVTVNLATPASNTGDAANDTFTFINNVFGSNFSDHITGNTNANRLDGGFGGNDQLTGLGGADTFVFHGNKLTITDFNQGAGAFNPAEGDQVDVTGFGLTPAEFSAIVNASTGVELSLPNGNAIELPGVDMHQLILTGNFIHS